MAPSTIVPSCHMLLLDYALTGRSREGGTSRRKPGRALSRQPSLAKSGFSALRSATPGSPPWFPAADRNQLEGRGGRDRRLSTPPLPNRRTPTTGRNLACLMGVKEPWNTTTPSASPRASRRRRPTAVLDAAAPWFETLRDIVYDVERRGAMELDRDRGSRGLERHRRVGVAGAVRFTQYSLMVFGHARIPIMSWMREQAQQSLAHAIQAGAGGDRPGRTGLARHRPTGRHPPWDHRRNLGGDAGPGAPRCRPLPKALGAIRGSKRLVGGIWPGR